MVGGDNINRKIDKLIEKHGTLKFPITDESLKKQFKEFANDLLKIDDSKKHPLKTIILLDFNNEDIYTP